MFNKLQQEAILLLTKIQSQCSMLFSELQDENQVVELGINAFELTDGETITSVFLEDSILKVQTEIQKDGEPWEYNFNEVANISDSLAMLKSLEAIKIISN